MPLWLATTPGGAFAVSYEAVMRPRPLQHLERLPLENRGGVPTAEARESAREFYTRLLHLCGHGTADGLDAHGHDHGHGHGPSPDGAAAGVDMGVASSRKVPLGVTADPLAGQALDMLSRYLFVEPEQ